MHIIQILLISKNKIFLIFISDELEKYHENSNESFSIYSLIKLYLNENYKFLKNFISNKLLSSSSSNK